MLRVIFYYQLIFKSCLPNQLSQNSTKFGNWNDSKSIFVLASFEITAQNGEHIKYWLKTLIATSFNFKCILVQTYMHCISIVFSYFPQHKSQYKSHLSCS